jgi:hypothetical protein
MKKKKKQRHVEDATNDVPLQELDPSKRPRSHAHANSGPSTVSPHPSHMGGWVKENEGVGGDADLEEKSPTRRRGRLGNDGKLTLHTY